MALFDKTHLRSLVSGNIGNIFKNLWLECPPVKTFESLIFRYTCSCAFS